VDDVRVEFLGPSILTSNNGQCKGRIPCHTLCPWNNFHDARAS